MIVSVISLSGAGCPPLYIIAYMYTCVMYMQYAYIWHLLYQYDLTVYIYIYIYVYGGSILACVCYGMVMTQWLQQTMGRARGCSRVRCATTCTSSPYANASPQTSHNTIATSACATACAMTHTFRLPSQTRCMHLQCTLRNKCTYKNDETKN